MDIDSGPDIGSGSEFDSECYSVSYSHVGIYSGIITCSGNASIGAAWE